MKFKHAINLLFSVMFFLTGFCSVDKSGTPFKQANHLGNFDISPLSGNSRSDFEKAKVHVTSCLQKALREKNNTYTNELLDVLRLLGELHVVDTNNFTRESQEAIRLDDALMASGEIEHPMVFMGRRNSPNIAKTRTRHKRMLDWNLSVLGYRTRLFDSIAQVVFLAQGEDRKKLMICLEEYVQLDFRALQVQSAAVAMSDYWELATHIGSVLENDSVTSEQSKTFLLRAILRFPIEIEKCKLVSAQGTGCGRRECDWQKLLRDYILAKEYFFEKCGFKKYYEGLPAQEKNKWSNLVKQLQNQ